MNDVWKKIEGVLTANNINIYGCAAAETLENEPEGYRPTDLLPGARSILCLALPVARGVYRSGSRVNKMYWRQANIYYRNLDLLTSNLAGMIEGQNEAAASVPACFPFDLKGFGDFWGFVNLARMAEAVGLGRIGRTGLLMHPDFGPRLHIGGLVTTLDLPQVTVGAGQAFTCPEDCHDCQTACPVDALDGQGRVDRVACVRKSSYSPLLEQFLKQKDSPISDPETLVNLTAVDDHQMYTCLECILACPRV